MWLALSLAALLALQDEVLVVTADGAPLKARELALRLEGGVFTLSAVDASGKRVSIQGEDVVEVVFNADRSGAPPKPGPEDVEIRLGSGDVWTGRLGDPDEAGIRLVSPALGNPLVKYEHIRAVLFSANRAFLPVRLPEKAENADLVLTRAGA
jgi:hypothetical protein